MKRMKERTHNLNVRVDDEELAMVHAISEASDVPATQLVRKWIKERYVERFGVQVPTPLATKKR
jgi:hypothetical protein